MSAKPATAQSCNTQGCLECAYSISGSRRIDVFAYSSFSGYALYIWGDYIADIGIGNPRNPPPTLNIGGYLYYPRGCAYSSWYTDNYGDSFNFCNSYEICRQPA